MNEQKLTPQEAFDNLTRALNFFKPLAYISESLKTYMDAIKEKDIVEKQLEEYRKQAEEWKKKQDEDRIKWKELEAKTIQDHINKAREATKSEEMKLTKVRENIEKERAYASEELQKLQALFMEKKQEQDAFLVKVGLDISQRKLELDNLGKVLIAKNREIEEQVQSHSLLREQLGIEKNKVEKEYMSVVEKLESIKKAALSLAQ